MTIKERKQITGTEAQIKDYAGHNGVLAYAKDTKHLHVLSGTAGETTELANMSDIPDAILKNGNRGTMAGYELWTKVGATTTLSVSSGDSVLMETAGRAATINVTGCPIGQIATKFVWVSLSNKSITINGITGWFGEDPPTLNKSNVVLMFFFHDGYTDCRLIGLWGEP